MVRYSSALSMKNALLDTGFMYASNISTSAPNAQDVLRRMVRAELVPLAGGVLTGRQETDARHLRNRLARITKSRW